LIFLFSVIVCSILLFSPSFGSMVLRSDFYECFVSCLSFFVEMVDRDCQHMSITKKQQQVLTRGCNPVPVCTSMLCFMSLSILLLVLFFIF
jgi:hypothetical protein